MDEENESDRDYFTRMAGGIFDEQISDRHGINFGVLPGAEELLETLERIRSFGDPVTQSAYDFGEGVRNPAGSSEHEVLEMVLDSETGVYFWPYEVRPHNE
jgi:hypothetical protein